MKTQYHNKMKRDLRMYERFNELYKVQKIRLDVLWDMLSQEFFIDKVQVQRRMKEMNDAYIAEAKKQTRLNV